uniref:SET domain-containing protein n=1 Tax=Neobodo designis TaxID=312471 RepID=A0A7S1QV27_NEODS
MAADRGCKFHVPTLVGVRRDGMRGLYIADGHEAKRNEPILTIPYRAFISSDRLQNEPGALPEATLEKIVELMEDEELVPVAPAIHLAVQQSHQMLRLPRNTRDVSNAAQRAMSAVARGETQTEAHKEALAAYEKVVNLYTENLMSWCRVVDDEDWNETHVQELYKPVLDQFQTNNYDDTLARFNKAIQRVHTKLNLDAKLEDVRRIARVVIARTEQVPLESDLSAPYVVRRLTKLKRSVLKQPTPRHGVVVPMVELINHSGRPNVAVRFGIYDGEPALRVQTIAPVGAARELCRHYNFAMDRSNAVFRYGFLPFEVASVPELSAWKNHYVDDIYPQLASQTAEEMEEERKVDAEVHRLENIFKNKKGGV